MMNHLETHHKYPHIYYLNQLKISSLINSPQQCANSIIFKKNMKKVKKMKYLGTTILKKTLNELDKSIHNEI